MNDLSPASRPRTGKISGRGVAAVAIGSLAAAGAVAWFGLAGREAPLAERTRRRLMPRGTTTGAAPSAADIRIA